jgi:hypothetical protein
MHLKLINYLFLEFFTETVESEVRNYCHTWLTQKSNVWPDLVIPIALLNKYSLNLWFARHFSAVGTQIFFPNESDHYLFFVEFTF